MFVEISCVSIFFRGQTCVRPLKLCTQHIITVNGAQGVTQNKEQLSVLHMLFG